MFLQNKYCRFHLFFPLSLWCSAFSAWNYYFFYTICYTPAARVQCVTCAAHYCTYFTQKIIRKIQTKTVKITICTLSRRKKRTRQIWHWLAFCKVRGKLSRAKKICVLLIMQIFPPPVMFCYCFFFLRLGDLLFSRCSLLFKL